MMSTRFEVYHKDKALAFGKDHACGEFLMIWDLTKGQEPEPDNILADEDRFTGFTKEKMLALIGKHGFALDELRRASLFKDQPLFEKIHVDKLAMPDCGFINEVLK